MLLETHRTVPCATELRGSFGIIEEHAYLPFTCENGKTTITLPQICGYLLIAAE